MAGAIIQAKNVTLFFRCVEKKKENSRFIGRALRPHSSPICRRSNSFSSRSVPVIFALIKIYASLRNWNSSHSLKQHNFPVSERKLFLPKWAFSLVRIGRRLLSTNLDCAWWTERKHTHFSYPSKNYTIFHAAPIRKPREINFVANRILSVKLLARIIDWVSDCDAERNTANLLSWMSRFGLQIGWRLACICVDFLF